MSVSGDAIYLLQHMGMSLQRQLDQVLLEQLGIGVSQYRIISALKAHPDISQRSLATNLGQTEASISRQIRVLQGKGLIITLPHPRSKRERVTNVSAKGLVISEAAQKLVDLVADTVFSKLSEKQQTVFKRALVAIHERSCSKDVPRSCDHGLELVDGAGDNASYILAIS